jgi:hypothetical protein
MRPIRTTLLAITALFLTFCGGSYNAREQLRDNVNRFNDAVRWGQYFSAAQWVGEDARGSWLASRQEWGNDVRIADYEVVDTQVLPGGAAATVRVVMSWYRLSESMLETSMLAQRWERVNRDWVMTSEEVVEGAQL